jgi:hypothetical protein
MDFAFLHTQSKTTGNRAHGQPKGNGATGLNPVTETDSAAFALFEDLCGQYEWCTDHGRAKMRKVLAALIGYYDTDFDAKNCAALNEMYDVALEDARLGRGDAEVENFSRNARARRINGQHTREV